MKHKLDRFPILEIILILTAILTLFVGLGSVPLFDKDEGAFSEATREMLLNRNFLMTYLNDEPRYDKPILIYWFQALSAILFGINEFAMRFPSALAGLIWAAATYVFTYRYLDRKKAFLATFFQLTALQVTIMSKAAIADSLLNLLIAATMFLLFIAYTERKRNYLYIASIIMGLGMLTKGPVALLIPAATTLIFCILQKDFKRWWHALKNPWVIGLFLLVTAPWYIAAIIDQGYPILEAWIGKHTVGRMSAPMEGHGGSIFYYVPVLLAGVLPFTWLLFGVLGRIRSYFKDPLNLYLLLWFGFVFLFFSIVRTKLPHYIVYGYTPLFILMARLFEEKSAHTHVKKDIHDTIHEDNITEPENTHETPPSPLLSTPATESRNIWQNPILLGLPSMLFVVLLATLPLLLPLVRPHITDEFAQVIIEEVHKEGTLGTAFQFPIFLACAAVLFIMLTPKLKVYIRLVVLGILMSSLINFHIMPTVASITQYPVREAALIAKERAYDVIMWKVNMPSFIFYSEQFVRRETPQTGDVVFTKSTEIEALGESEILYQKKGYVLLRVLSPGTENNEMKPSLE